MLELRKRCKGFVVVISPDARTRMMAMVLSTKTVEQNKSVRILLCDPGGELDLKDSKTERGALLPATASSRVPEPDSSGSGTQR